MLKGGTDGQCKTFMDNTRTLCCNLLLGWVQFLKEEDVHVKWLQGTYAGVNANEGIYWYPLNSEEV